jgi:hypothetical protein
MSRLTQTLCALHRPSSDLDVRACSWLQRAFLPGVLHYLIGATSTSVSEGTVGTSSWIFRHPTFKRWSGVFLGEVHWERHRNFRIGYFIIADIRRSVRGGAWTC